jgi:hypothetical protein
MITQGHLGEAKVFADLVAQGYYVFYTPLEGCSVDFLISKDCKEFKRVQVKSVRQHNTTSYTVDLKGGYNYYGPRQGHPSKDFDGTKSDILAVYIVLLDRCIYFDSPKITQKRALSVNKQKLLKGDYCDTIEELFG